MKNKIWTGLLTLALALLITVPAGAQNPQVSFVDVQTLQKIMQSRKVILVDVSAMLSCMDSKIPDSICLSCNGKINSTVFSSWRKDNKIIFYNGKTAVDPNCPLIAETLRMGFTDVSILAGGLPAWRLAGNKVEAQYRIPRVFSHAVYAKNLSAWRKQTRNPLIIDIRSAKSYAVYHLDGSLNIPLAELQVRYSDIPLDHTLLIVDEDGSDGLLVASYLARKGFLNIKRLRGGMQGYRQGAP